MTATPTPTADVDADADRRPAAREATAGDTPRDADSAYEQGRADEASDRESHR